MRFMMLFLLMFASALTSVSSGAERNIVAAIHASPPSPCVSKAPDDMSHGMKTNPEGIAREDVVRVQSWMAAHMVSRGRKLLFSESGRTVDKAYTAVFYQGQSINEVGIYAYRFIKPIRSDDFAPGPEFNGRLFVYDNELLVLLWHKGLERTGQCFSAIEKALEAHAQGRK